MTTMPLMLHRKVSLMVHMTSYYSCRHANRYYRKAEMFLCIRAMGYFMTCCKFQEVNKPYEPRWWRCCLYACACLVNLFGMLILGTVRTVLISFIYFFLSVFYLNKANQRDVIAAVTGIVNCLDCLTLKWDGWPWQTTIHLFYSSQSVADNSIAICELKL